jgi:murein DD-endopeptidase MepM/ murein hydrolase activator NlpD
MGERYAIDFVGVDEQRRTAERRDWRTVLATEPPERFLSFGRALVAPADGVVVQAHDGEVDHAGRRSQLALVPYALGQGARLRRGVEAIAGNYVVIELASGCGYVALAHLMAGSLRVGVGQSVTTGRLLASCGSSGNSTQPHLHVQVMDRVDLSAAQGLPMQFRHYREWPRGAKEPLVRDIGVPAEGAVIEPLAPARSSGASRGPRGR